jgi:hypothetical protein
MNTAIKAVGLSILCGVMAAAHAQSPAAPPNATPADVPAGDASAKSPAVPAPAPAKAAKPSKSTALSEAGEPRANTSAAAGAPAGAPAGASRPSAASGQKKGPDATDKLELGTATVTGDREQPKVMYIVPWKKSDIGDLAGKPMNSLVDEILAPVDRDVFKREVLYYKAVQADSAQNGAPSRPSQGEK